MRVDNIPILESKCLFRSNSPIKERAGHIIQPLLERKLREKSINCNAQNTQDLKPMHSEQKCIRWGLYQLTSHNSNHFNNSLELNFISFWLPFDANTNTQRTYMTLKQCYWTSRKSKQPRKVQKTIFTSAISTVPACSKSIAKANRDHLLRREMLFHRRSNQPPLGLHCRSLKPPA